MKWSRGPSRQAPTPGTARPASCANVCPPRLDPPVPRRTTSVAPAASRCAALAIPSRSSRRSGSRSSGSLPSAWRARSHSSAPAVRAIASFKAFGATPCPPMRSSRASSIDWTTVIEVSDAEVGRRSGPLSMMLEHIPRHGRACPGHPRLTRRRLKTWMPATSAGMTTSRSAALGGRRLRAADHGDEETAVEQALRHPLHVGERHRIDEAVALVDVVDAEILELDLHELPGDLGRGVEAQRERALLIGLGLGELVLGRAGLGEATDFLFHHFERLAGAVAAGRRRGNEQG